MALDEKTRHKLEKEVEQKKKKVTEIKATDPRGVIRLSRLPWGFEEWQMKKYFSQFGHVTRIKLCRSKRTGGSKGMAYIEFLDPVVAKIVSDTMNGYIMFNNVLKCEIVPPEKVSHRLFRPFIPPPDYTALNAQRFNSKDRALNKNSIEKQNKKMKALGIDYEFNTEKKQTEIN
uniref:RRM domain-containing protein n=1 Tax=Arcella intermedia TaxID=1963864 RepID=A0A6B2LJT4_9EUKA